MRVYNEVCNKKRYNPTQRDEEKIAGEEWMKLLMGRQNEHRQSKSQKTKVYSGKQASIKLP
jgi:hypothetical protein